MSDAGALPQEIITVILSRLPFKSLSRFKCVSPSWKALISSPHFAETRLNRTKANYHPLKAILFTRSFDLYSVDFADANPTPKKLDPPSFDHVISDSMSVSSCDGLVLVSFDGYDNFLGNPSTSEWKELPFPFPRYISMDVFYPPWLGYVASADDYKVVMPLFKAFRQPDHAAVRIVAVYSLTTNAWRMIQDFHYHLAEHRRGVCFNGRLHWLCWRTDDLDYSDVVVAFDLVDEIFREVQLPASYDYNVSRDHEMVVEMVVLEGCLCLLVWSMSDRIDVWMMMDYGVKEPWMNFFSIANPGRSIVDVLCLSVQDELVLRRERFTGIRGRVDSVEDEFDGDKLILCNPMQGTRREVVVPGIPTTSLVGGDHYIETLRCPNHGGRIPETM
ncbi:F-box/kelch-repeat protein At3g06240-like [Rhododendron vialii]|uniref:F-box/kelch-repeat protein At3g06240-like n=1 Tax=Rhododendron vialii TaxID=182163 RepID=UPI00265E189A|nr:F-box/kelch-repeat protein At3g06240-like [Rhododendron vialii]XP_058198315.1 F-box/kelch-repeat protein At3g06240-like [Rhododendron vialii]XP_058198322.1 F-box/kelch-repeat protein At3g06240-like [Rhododendron vialii]XP_058198329.1 F-box/kelch-repeat protein At3g06240-like [Rhododendron vialii]XP_058198334.1 F-box/kelch-repeat protein At3g06240-like [Rhododendron vialii]